MAYSLAAPGLLTCAPIDTGQVSITGSGSSWGNSSWVEVVASLGQQSILLGLAVSFAVGNQHEYDIGLGDVGEELVIATLRGAANVSAQVGQLLLPIPYGPVSAGTRVAVRVRRDTTSTSATSVKLLYLAGAPASVTTTTAVAVCTPSAATGLSVTGHVTDWVNGSWVQVTASTAAAWVVAGLVVRQTAFATGVFEADLGVGAGGAESVVTTLRWSANDNFAFPSVLMCWPPFDGIGAGVRVAMRMRGTENATFRFAVQYYEKPV